MLQAAKRKMKEDKEKKTKDVKKPDKEYPAGAVQRGRRARRDDDSSMMCVYAGPEYFAGMSPSPKLPAIEADRASMMMVYAGPMTPTAPSPVAPANAIADIVCKECGCNNPARAKFCMECGTKLEAVKTANGDIMTVLCVCGSKVPAGQKFCPVCGAPLTRIV